MVENVTIRNRSIGQGRAKQILVKVADNSGDITTTQLIQLTGLQRPGVSGYLQVLRKAGFVESRKSLADKRVYYHSLLPEGRRFLDENTNSNFSRSFVEPVKDLTSMSERSAEAAARKQRLEKKEDLNDLLNLSDDLNSDDEPESNFDDNQAMSF